MIMKDHNTRKRNILKRMRISIPQVPCVEPPIILQLRLKQEVNDGKYDTYIMEYVNSPTSGNKVKQ